MSVPKFLQLTFGFEYAIILLSLVLAIIGEGLSAKVVRFGSMVVLILCLIGVILFYIKHDQSKWEVAAKVAMCLIFASLWFHVTIQVVRYAMGKPAILFRKNVVSVVYIVGYIILAISTNIWWNHQRKARRTEFARAIQENQPVDPRLAAQINRNLMITTETQELQRGVINPKPPPKPTTAVRTQTQPQPTTHVAPPTNVYDEWTGGLDFGQQMATALEQSRVYGYSPTIQQIQQIKEESRDMYQKQYGIVGLNDEQMTNMAIQQSLELARQQERDDVKEEEREISLEDMKMQIQLLENADFRSYLQQVAAQPNNWYFKWINDNMSTWNETKTPTNEKERLEWQTMVWKSFDDAQQAAIQEDVWEAGKIAQSEIQQNIDQERQQQIEKQELEARLESLKAQIKAQKQTMPQNDIPDGKMMLHIRGKSDETPTKLEMPADSKILHVQKEIYKAYYGKSKEAPKILKVKFYVGTSNEGDDFTNATSHMQFQEFWAFSDLENNLNMQQVDIFLGV